MGEIIVKAGDTLSELALVHLGNADRWAELYALNGPTIASEQERYPARHAMRGPDWIFPGTRLRLPDQPSPPRST